MADASIQFLLQNLSSLIKSEIGLISGVNDDINTLSSNLTTIQSRLQDAEDKQFGDQSTRNWLRKLNDLYYEIEDVLDESVTELARLEFKNIISKMFKKISCKDKIARRIKEVRENLDNVEAESKMFKSSEDTAESSKQSSTTETGSVLNETPVLLQSKLPANRETGSLLTNPNHVIGRGEESKDIVDFLVNEDRDLYQLSVLAIIGLGGLGKTTLARLVYNDKRVADHFEIKLWVCVSDDFDQKTLIKAMLASSSQSTSDKEPLDALQQKLFQLLNQKRYLLVLDDVWNDDLEKWLMLKNQLECGSTGSSIIVTTREEKVVEIMATTAHNLKVLSEENCWLLFKERAFGHEEGGNKILEDIGRDIVKKCAGVPLAATTLGGLLRSEKREKEWIRVKESPIWRLPQKESSILPALRLSYNHLPLTHRPCFAYCAVFPKDSRIEKDDLIRQWMAQGYISSDGTSDMEETGDKIFNELVLRSLFLNVITYNDGRITFFQMHDLVHDLAQSIMDNKVPRPQATPDSTLISSSSVRLVNLRKRYAAFPWRIISDVDLFSIFTQFNRLRSLDASDSEISDVPPAIGKLIQLRYLNLSGNEELKTLPEELCGLWNLKTLDLHYCSGLERLPKGMRKLRNLRHLFLEDCFLLTQMPPKIGKLTSLKTMRMFIVGEERNNQVRELQSLVLLAGHLKITHLERVKEKYLDANAPILADKQKLRNLKLEWDSEDPSSGRESLDEKVMEVLEPHPNVETLIIDGFEGKNITLWRGCSNPQIKLVELCLWECNNCSHLPQVLVESPHLKKLELNFLRSMEYIVEDEEGCDLRSVKFPVLEVLELSWLDNLKGLLRKETGEFFPNLQKLNVGCSPLLSLPQLSSLVNLRCINRIITSAVGGNKFENLSTLRVWMEAEDVIPKECLTNNLKFLEIMNATDEAILPEVGLQQGLKSLKTLYIRGGKLRCLPGRWLSHHLTSLEELGLYYCDEMVEIPEEIKYLYNLKELTIERCHKLVEIPEEIKYLINLKKLTISNCRKIESIPSGIQQLTQLKTLDIYKCSPELKKRCEKGKADDWHNIQHIPNIHIRD